MSFETERGRQGVPHCIEALKLNIQVIVQSDSIKHSTRGSRVGGVEDEYIMTQPAVNRPLVGLSDSKQEIGLPIDLRS
jgi:hypothetical protein